MPDMPRQRRHDLIVAVLFGLALYILWVVRHTLLLIFISILFAIVFMPAIRAIQRWRIYHWRPGRGAAILILLLCVIGVIAIIATFMLPPIIGDIQHLIQDVPSQLHQFADRVKHLPFGKKLASDMDAGRIVSYLEGSLQHTISTATSIAGGILDLSVIVLLTAYFILDSEGSFNWAMSLVPVNRRSRLRATLLRAAKRAQHWLMGQILLMLILGGLTALVLGLMHVRYFYALAVFAGFANFVPVIGPVATVVLAGAVALLDSWLKLVGVIIFYLSYQQLENAFLTPKIMQARVGLSGVTVIAALSIGGALAGILGALVAVPSAAMLGTVLDEYAVQKESD